MNPKYPLHDFKYLLVPGYITSHGDAQGHWITTDRLKFLYGLHGLSSLSVVHMQESLVRNGPSQHFAEYIETAEAMGYIVLEPRYTGDYIEHRTAMEEAQVARESSDRALQSIAEQIAKGEI